MADINWSEVLRRLADAIDDGAAVLTETSVDNDTDLIEVPSEPHSHQRLDVVFVGQRLRVIAFSKRNLVKAG